MSLFLCGRCDGYADSDEGAEDWGKAGLICADCLALFDEIKTHATGQPTPHRGWDWAAVTDNYDGAPDSSTRHQVGTGETRGEAIKDLIENYLEDAA